MSASPLDFSAWAEEVEDPFAQTDAPDFSSQAESVDAKGASKSWWPDPAKTGLLPDDKLDFEPAPAPQPQRRTSSRDPVSIRFANPGAMHIGPSARKFGATNAEIIRGHPFAVFPDAESGAAAQFDLLGAGYTGMTLRDALRKWSGGDNADTYTAAVSRATGLSPDTVLTPEMIRDPKVAVPLAKAMARVEAGRDYPLSDEQWLNAHARAFGGAAPATQPIPAPRTQAQPRTQAAPAAPKGDLLQRILSARPEDRAKVVEDYLYEMTGATRPQPPAPLDFSAEAELPDFSAEAEGVEGARDDRAKPSFADAFGRGVDIAQQLGFGAVEAFGELTGLEGVTQWGREGRERNIKEAEAYGPRAKFTEIGGIGDFIQWAKETAGELIPLMAPSMAGFGVGAAAGAPLGPLGATIGGLIGAFVPGLALGVGEVQSAIKEKDPEAVAPGWAFAGGTAIAALDTILPGKVGTTLVRAFGRETAEQIAQRALTKPAKEGWIKRGAKGAAKGMAVEGVTEVIQEAIAEVTAAQATDQPVDWSQLGEQMIEAGAAGALMGGLVGGPTGIIEGRGRKEPPPDRKALPPPASQQAGSPAAEAGAPAGGIEADIAVLLADGWDMARLAEMDAEEIAAEAQAARERGVKPAQAPDQPSAEPIKDLVAQARDLVDPKKPRRGLYLSRDNLNALLKNQKGQQELIKTLQGKAVSLDNFDGKGGMLVVPDDDTAQWALDQRNAGRDMQEILGELTGAGQGKPADGTAVVQQVTPEGAVTQESLVTPEQVEPTIEELEQPDRGVRVVTPEEAIRRRAEEIASEQAAQGDGSRNRPVKVQTPEDVERAGERVQEPTEAQAEAGNYRKGHVRIGGLDISIETPKGGIRRGTGPDGTPWEVEMPAHYGYVKRTTGKDGDQVDVYVGDAVDSDRVWVVDQVDADTGKFDEHKAFLGFASEDEVRAAYEAAFTDGRAGDRFGGITEMSLDEFKQWLAKGKRTRPLRDLKKRQAEAEAAKPAEEPAEPEREAPALEPGQVPSFGDVLDVLPKDENGDPDVVWLVGKIRELTGKAVWNQLTDDEKRKVWADITGQPAQAEPSKPAPAKPAEEPAKPDEVLKIGTGDLFRSRSGRELSPAPKIDTSTEGRLRNSIKRLQRWLLEEAKKEAEYSGHDLERISLKAIDLKNLSQSDLDTINLILFGDPDGPRSSQLIARGEDRPKKTTPEKPITNEPALGIEKSDSPRYRIASILAARGYDAQGGAEAIRNGLRELGLDIPPLGDQPFAQWLDDVLSRVPAGVVMGTASRLPRADEAKPAEQAKPSGEVQIERRGDKELHFTLGGGRLVARIANDGALEIRQISVPDSERGQGIGSSLYLAALEEAERRKVKLYTDGKLTPAALRALDRLRNSHNVGLVRSDGTVVNEFGAWRSDGRAFEIVRGKGDPKALDLDKIDQEFTGPAAELLNAGLDEERFKAAFDKIKHLSLKDLAVIANDYLNAPSKGTHLYRFKTKKQALDAIRDAFGERLERESKRNIIDQITDARPWTGPRQPEAEPDAKSEVKPKGELNPLYKPGARFRSRSDRVLSPVPDVDLSTDEGVARFDQWLRDEAIKEAKVEGNDSVVGILQRIDPKNLTAADREMMNQVVFGQPDGPSRARVVADEPKSEGRRWQEGHRDPNLHLLLDGDGETIGSVIYDGNRKASEAWTALDSDGNVLGHARTLADAKAIVERHIDEGAKPAPKSEPARGEKPAETPFEKASREAKEYVLRKGKFTQREHGVTVRPDGTSIITKIDPKSSPYVIKIDRETTPELFQDSERTVDLHHNHIRSTSFSIEDLALGTFVPGVKRLHAHGHNGSSYHAEFLRKPDEWEAVRRAYEHVEEELRRIFIPAVEDGQVNRDIVNQYYNHLVAQVMHEAGVIRYSYEFPDFSAEDYIASLREFIGDEWAKIVSAVKEIIDVPDRRTPTVRDGEGVEGAPSGAPQTRPERPTGEEGYGARPDDDSRSRSEPEEVETENRLAPLIARLRREGFKNIVDARKFVKDIGILPADANNKRIDETIETAVVLAGREIVAEGGTPAEIYNRLVELYRKQPNLSTRTGTSVANQAYSTPVPLAYLASRLGRVASADVVYEPTAGNGALLIEADPSRQDVHANEIDPERAAELEYQGFKVTQNDATERAHVGKPADVIIMNPPFGAVREDGKSKSWTIDGWTTTQVDHAIALESLKALKDDGRAVLILGGVKAESVEERRQGYRGQAKREFYWRLYNNYNVVDHFTVDGDLYRKQGAGWPVDVIVIEGKGKSQRRLPAADPPVIYDSWEALAEKIHDTAGDATAPGRPVSPVGAPVEGGTRPAVGDEGPRTSTTGRKPERLPAEPRDDAGRVRGDGDRRESERVRDRRDGEPALEPQRDRDRGRPDQSIDTDRVGPRVERPKRVRGEEKGGQATYEPKSGARSLNTLIPVNMADAATEALRRIEQRHGPIDEFVAERLGYRGGAKSNEFLNAFSAEQVDAIALAIDNIERGAAFIIGDQTGIGKGRINAAMLRYAIRQGKIPILVTEKPDLYGDMWRDMRDIGFGDFLGREPRIFITNTGEMIPVDEEALEWKQEADAAKEAGLPIPKRYGQFLTGGTAARQQKEMDAIASGKGNYDVIFTTYDQMNTVRGQETPRRSFLRRIAPNALISFDESHNAGGAGQGGWKAKDAPMNRAEFARELASSAWGVMFSSATYAKRPEVMDLYARTDMGRAVDKADELPNLIARGGVPLQQIVASMLTQAGQYIRRERSFEGVEYVLEGVEVNEEAYEHFSKAVRAIFKFDLEASEIKAAFLQSVLDEIGAVGGKDKGTGDAGASTISFGSVMHNVVNQMLLAIKAEAVAERAIRSFKDGEKPVIALASTMEAFIRDFAAGEGINFGDEIDLSFRDVLARYLRRTLRITITHPDKRKEYRYIPVDALPPELQRMYRDALDIINEGVYDGMPISPIDYIRNKLTKAGLRVVEVTGRQTMIDYSGDKPIYTQRPQKERGPTGKRSSIAKFNRGDLDVLIINRSGSTGVSMHASSQFKDQRRRRMIIAQAEANIDTHLQTLGRIHRTGQVVPPAYSQIAAAIPAEARPAAILMKKMASLNANTTGARGSVFTVEAVDFLNEVGDEVVERIMLENPQLRLELGNPIQVDSNGKVITEDAARVVTGRLTLLPPKLQAELLDRISADYKAEIEHLEQLGQNPLEAKTVDLQARVLESTEIKGKQGEGPFLDAVYLEKVSVKSQGRAMPPDEVAGQIAEAIRAKRPDGDPAVSLSTLESLGRQWARKRMEEVGERARNFINAEVMSVSKESREKTRERLEDVLRRWMATMQVTYPGARVKLNMPAGEVVGIVLSVTRPGKAQNPVAPGAWEVRIAVPSGEREYKFPMSKLFPPAVPKGDDEKGAEIQADNTPIQRFIELFEEARREGRETRLMFTGNILAAYDQAGGRGQIIMYTTEDGQLKPGILMGREFSQEKFMKSRRVRLLSGEAVARFIERASSPHVKSTDGFVRLGRLYGVPYIEVNPSRQKGGKYYTDEKVRQILRPLEFEKKRAWMNVEGVPRDKLTAAVDRMIELGAIFEVNESQDVAEQINAELAPKQEQLPVPARSTQPSTVGQKIQKFSNAVDNLANELGVEVRRISPDDEISKALGEDLPEPLEGAVTRLKDQLAKIQRGPRTPVIANYIAGYVSEVDRIVKVWNEQNDIDHQEASIAELRAFLSALSNFAQIVEATAQKGYRLSEDVLEARDEMTETLEDASNEMDDIEADADNLVEELQDLRERIHERLDELKPGWDQVEDEVEEAEEETQGTEVVEYRVQPATLIAREHAKHEVQEDDTVLDVSKVELRISRSVLKTLTDRAQEVLEYNLDEADFETASRLLERSWDLTIELLALRNWANRFSTIAYDKSREAFDIVDDLHEQELVPAIDQIDEVRDEVESRTTEAEEWLIEKQELAAGQIIEIDGVEYGPTWVERTIANWRDELEFSRTRIEQIESGELDLGENVLRKYREWIPRLEADIAQWSEALRRYREQNPDGGQLSAALAYTDAQTGRTMRRALDELGYYSQALEAAKALKQAKGTPEQMLAQLKKAGVKDAEIAATGLDQFLQGKKSVTRDEIVRHLEENRVRLREVVRSKQAPVSAEEYARESAEEYAREAGYGSVAEAAEVLRMSEEEFIRAVGDLQRGPGDTKWSNYTLDPDNPTYRETVLHLPMDAAPIGEGELAQVPLEPVLFQSGHFPEPNIIGHLMTSLVKDDKGNTVYLIDQIQSDWGQRIRDKGARDEAKIAELEARLAKLNEEYSTEEWAAHQTRLAQRMRELPVGSPEWFEVREQYYNDPRAMIQAEIAILRAATPPHPLVNTTDQWVNTTLRRAIRQAVEAGADYIAIPSGDTVLSYNPGDVRGMREFYDNIVPKNLRKLLAKLDKQTPPPERIGTLETPTKGETGEGFTVFRLTPETKRRVMEEGQAMFALLRPRGRDTAEADRSLRKSVEALIKLGGIHRVPENVTQATLEAAAEARRALPRSVKVGAITAIRPNTRPDRHPEADVVVTFREADGSEFDVELPLKTLLASRALYHRGLDRILLVRLALFENFGPTVGGEVWHEVIHALRRNGSLRGAVWSRLLRHAAALRVLDMPMAEYLRRVGSPGWQNINPERTLRNAYMRDFAEAPHPQQRLDEEAVAHMIELARHGYWTSEQLEPIADILEWIASGEAAAAPVPRWWRDPALYGNPYSRAADDTIDEGDRRNLSRELADAVNIISRIAGKEVDVQFYDTIGADIASSEQREATERAGLGTGTAGGFYRRGTLNARALIGLATNDPAFDPRTAAGHEAWHHVEQELATVQELQLINSPSEMQRTRRLAAAELGMDPDDPRLERLPASELRAIAFQRYRRMREEGAQPAGIHIAVRRLWDRIIRAFQAVRNVISRRVPLREALAGSGSTEAIFERARTGELAARDLTELRSLRDRVTAWFTSRRAQDDLARYEEADTLEAFAATRFERDPSAALTTIEAYRAYVRWAVRNAQPFMTEKEFMDWLQEHGYRVEEVHGLHRIIGVRWTPTGEYMERTRRWLWKDKATGAASYIPEMFAANDPYEDKYAEAVARQIEKRKGVRLPGRRGGPLAELEKKIEEANQEVTKYRPGSPEFNAAVRRLDELRDAYDRMRGHKWFGVIEGGRKDTDDTQASLIPAALTRRAKRVLMRQMNRIDRARVLLQDRFLPMRRLQEAIEEDTGVTLPLSLDVYLAEALYHGRAGERLTDLQTKYIEPMLERLRAAGLTIDQLGEYLYARHAIERNATIRSRDPQNDAGSGMSDAEAQGILDRIARSGKQADYDAAADIVYEMIEDARRTMLRSGLIGREKYEAWRNMWRRYVPLRGFEFVEDDDLMAPDRPRIGRGFDIRGREAFAALGRTTKAENPVLYAVLQAQQAIIRAEKNRVDKVFFKLVQAHPDPNLWKVYRGEYRRRLNPDTGLVEKYWVPPQFVRKENIYGVKIGGKQYYVEIKHPAVARAMRGTGSEVKGTIIGEVMFKVARTYAALLTSWNPEFLFSNMLRDVQTALINVGDVAERPEGIRRKIVKEALSAKAIRGALQALRGDTSSEYARWFEEFRHAGGKISWLDFNDVERIKKNMEKSLKQGRAARTFRYARELVEDLNTAVENGVRLSVYKALRENGVAQDRAAFIARELTVNFNRKGEWGPGINAAYLFFNASLQGTVRIAQAFMRSKAVRYAVGSIFATGFALDLINYLIADDDDDGQNTYDRIPDWVKERNMIIMIPGDRGHGYIQIPLPYGYNVPFLAGQQLAAVLRGSKKPLDAAGLVAGGAVEAFNPIGTAASFYQTIAPTFMDPMIQVLENKTWYGAPIYPTKYDRRQPWSETYFESAPWWAVETARVLNSVSGGSPARPGAIDVPPDVLRHYAEFAMGGVGKFVLNAWATGERLVTGDEWLPEQTPILRRLYGKSTTMSRRREFYDAWNDIDQAYYEMRQLAKDGDMEGARRVREEYKLELAVYPMFKAIAKDLRSFRERRARVESDPNLSRSEKLRQNDELIKKENALIMRALGAYNKAIKEVRQN